MEIVIISGSKSDSHIVEQIEKTLKDEQVQYSSFIASAHRSPDLLDEIINESTKSARVYICVAGLSAALPGVVASKVKQPVIGVPVSAKLGGIDALLSIVQMPPGVPVASVGIDNGKNAAYLAVRILRT